MEDLIKQLTELKDNFANCPLPELTENGGMSQYYQEQLEYNIWAHEQYTRIEELEAKISSIESNVKLNKIKQNEF